MEPLVLQYNPFNGTQLCSDYDVNVFFPETYNDRAAVARAKKICDGCWLKAECFEYAVKFPSMEGIWAGTTPQDRKRLRLQSSKI